MKRSYQTNKSILLVGCLLCSVTTLAPVLAQSSSAQPVAATHLLAARRHFVVTSGTGSNGANIWVTNAKTGKTAFRRIYGAQSESSCALQLSNAAAEVGLNPRLMGGNGVEMDGNLSINVQGFLYKEA